MSKQYYLLITYPGADKPVILNTGGKAIDANLENREILVATGKMLLEENIISTYQVVVTDGDKIGNDNVSNRKL
jgi:hypothetical protein